MNCAGWHSPDEAVFYTSGRTSNEAAFLYQLMVRSFGTNNLPDCSNMCHESSGAALVDAIGIGKGSVTVEDVTKADLIVIAGQNPGHQPSPHAVGAGEGEGQRRQDHRGQPAARGRPDPVQGSAEGARRCRPRHPDRRRVRADPARRRHGAVRRAGPAAARGRRPRRPARSSTATSSTRTARTSTSTRPAPAQSTWTRCWRRPGIDRAQLDRVATMLADFERTIACWAMGLTQHRHAVPMIAEVTNVLLMRGMIGKPGAGVCPVRGHSNVQGDRTMGIWEKMPESSSPHWTTGSASSARASTASTPSTRSGPCATGAPRCSWAWAATSRSATPDTAVTEAALRSCSLTVQVSTKLNRSHVVHGRDRADPAVAGPHRPRYPGRRQTAWSRLRIRCRWCICPAAACTPRAIRCAARWRSSASSPATLLGPDHPVPWEKFNDDYDPIRDAIAAVVPGCDDYNTKVRQPDGFQLPHAPRDSREFPTSTGKANFAVNPLEWVPVPPGRLVLQTLRSHDQYNTTIYGLDDRYRGVKGGRRVVFVNPADIEAFGLREGDRVDLVSEFTNGDGQLQERTRQGLHGGGLLDAGRQRRGLLPGDQFPRAAGSHRGRGRIRRCLRRSSSDWNSKQWATGDRTAAGQSRHRRRRGDAARDAGRRGAAGDPGQRQAGHRHDAHAGLRCRTGARLSAHRGRHRAP